MRGVKCVRDVDKAGGVVSDGKYAIALCGFNQGSSVYVADNCLVYLQPNSSGSFQGLRSALSIVPCSKLKAALKVMKGMGVK